MSKQSASIIPVDLLTPKPFRTTRPVTTGERIVTSPYIPKMNVRQTAPSPSKIARFGNSSAFPGGGIPKAPTLLYISEAFQPAAGVYLMPSSTGSGKSILSSALVAWANDSGVAASYNYVFEPRAEEVRSGKGLKFEDPSAFVDDVRALFKGVGDVTTPRLVVFDSGTLPMKAYASNFDNQATFPGGSQPSDRGFLDEMSKMADDYTACIVITLNSTLIPYAADLLGAVEGMMTITDVANFAISDRTSYSARTPKPIQIPLDYVDAALAAWNFGTYRRGSTSGSNSSRSGIYAKRS